MQIDIGFGDVITHGAKTITYPALLDFPAARLSGYPRETVIAEKFQAMVYLRTANSRMKDFYDVWLLATTCPFEGNLLGKAISATFANRSTAIDNDRCLEQKEIARAADGGLDGLIECGGFQRLVAGESQSVDHALADGWVIFHQQYS